jgi:CrcB protein
MDLRLILAVALGGAAGSVLRYALGYAIQARLLTVFPVGTLIVNVTGSLLLGFLVRFVLDTPAVSVETRLLVTTGFCGGYTTFSTFSYETARLIEDGDWVRAGSYVTASVVLSIAATFVGIALARAVVAARRGV